ncbi:hypothetical protein GPECTOR_44g56 [Gonium pectorale]|uniref:Uncharacterized protein n=1 Tax=Gonium pectorale TaxID=33097 RepID=A0A150GAK4_GONPE|nr:hypothetical protein GPECTOR_44g56 [Gonium pectorale]|eukprot:KXZ46380.1 hypothetical protein GPECTOR_44g56 [Gonium pectorale]
MENSAAAFTLEATLTPEQQARSGADVAIEAIMKDGNEGASKARRHKRLAGLKAQAFKRKSALAPSPAKRSRDKGGAAAAPAPEVNIITDLGTYAAVERSTTPWRVGAWGPTGLMYGSW